MTKKPIDWNPNTGDALQGDIILFKIGKEIEINPLTKVMSQDNRLILAEGEITGHHHAIGLHQPTMFRDDALARDVEAKLKPSVSLYKDPKVFAKLVEWGELTTTNLGIGVLVVEGDYVTLYHDEHDPIRIPPGKYYVGNQQEFDVEAYRKIQD